MSAARRVRLTDARVEALRPEAREYTVWNDDPKKLGVRVLPSGRKVYVLRIRQDGAQRWVKIGEHGDGWTSVSARDKALALLGVKAQGGDPTRLRAEVRGIPSVGRLAVKYLKDYGEAYLKPSSQERLRDSLRHVVKKFRKVRVDRLTQDDVITMHRAMKATPTAANRAVVALHGLMKFAILKGHRPDNPAHKTVRYYRETARERYLTADETTRLARTLAEADESPFVLGAVKLILLTGCRQGEIFGLTWAEVDLDRGLLKLKDSKGGPRAVFLNTIAQDVLRNLPRIEGSPYVVPGWKKGAHFKGEQRAWERIRDAANLPGLRLHDLRHNYASVLASGGASLQMIGKLLGHKTAAATQRYAHLVDTVLHELTERAAAGDLRAVAAPPARGTVTPMRRGRR